MYAILSWRQGNLQLHLCYVEILIGAEQAIALQSRNQMFTCHYKSSLAYRLFLSFIRYKISSPPTESWQVAKEL